MAISVYVLCSTTSLACTLLLLRGFRKTGVRLLMWSSLCFAGMMLNNVMLLVDLVVLPHLDLSMWRKLPVLFGLGALLFGMIWESR